MPHIAIAPKGSTTPELSAKIAMRDAELVSRQPLIVSSARLSNFRLLSAIAQVYNTMTRSPRPAFPAAAIASPVQPLQLIV